MDWESLAAKANAVNLDQFTNVMRVRMGFIFFFFFFNPISFTAAIFFLSGGGFSEDLPMFITAKHGFKSH